MARGAGGTDFVDIGGWGMGAGFPLNIVKAGAGGRTRLRHNRIANSRPRESVIIRALHVDERRVPGIMVRNVHVTTVGRDPGWVGLGRVDNAGRTPVNRQAAGRRTRTGDRRYAELGAALRGEEKNQGRDMHPARGTEIDVSITRSEDRFARVLQPAIYNAGKSRRRAEQSGPERRPEGRGSEQRLER